MVLRWTAATALEGERRRRIRGYKLLNLLREALGRKSVDTMKEVG